MHHIAIVIGTGREGRQSEKVARRIEEELQKISQVSASIVDVRDCLVSPFTQEFNEDDASQKEHRWYQEVQRADAFIFVLPEYRHTYPGEWKLLMDSLRKKEYVGKIAGIVGVSDGSFGGVRAVEQATLLCSILGMHVLTQTLHFPHSGTEFDIQDTEAQRTRIHAFLETLEETISKYR